MPTLGKKKYELMLVAAASLDPEDPEFYVKLARAGKMHTKGAATIAKTAFNKGYPDLGFPPIREALLADSSYIRELKMGLMAGIDVNNAAERKRIEAEAKARIDALRTSAQELQLVEVVRLNLTDVCKTVSDLLKHTKVLGDAIEKKLSEIAASVVEGKLSMKELEQYVRIIERISRITAQSTTAAQTVAEVERLVGGKPTSIVEVKRVPDAKDVDDLAEQAMYRAQQLKRATERTN